jgi:hypothetical protein
VLPEHNSEMRRTLMYLAIVTQSPDCKSRFNTYHFCVLFKDPYSGKRFLCPMSDKVNNNHTPGYTVVCSVKCRGLSSPGSLSAYADSLCRVTL